MYTLRSLFLVLLALLLAAAAAATPQNSQDSLRLKLLHRSSLQEHSAYYTQEEFKAPVISGHFARPSISEFLVEFYIGTPPKKFMLVVDTGSDLLWVNCSSCKEKCLRNPESALFARHSLSFTPIHWYEPDCELAPNSERIHNSCKYNQSYGDGSSSSGIFSRETVTLNKSSGEGTKITNVMFGCGIKSSQPHATAFPGAHGVLGLGKGRVSFTSQFGKLFGNTFSYCLVNFTFSPPQTSFLEFGHTSLSASVKKSIRYTPILPWRPLSKKSLSCTTFPVSGVRDARESFYYVGIDKVFVGGVFVPIPSSIWSIDDQGNGGTIIDSGTTFTSIVDPAYQKILEQFTRTVSYPRLDGSGLSDLCFNVSGIPEPLQLPKLTIVFKGNARFDPPPSNYFVNIGDFLGIPALADVMCLALNNVSYPDSSTIGNLLQQNFLITYDTENSRLGFAHTDCSSS